MAFYARRFLYDLFTALCWATFANFAIYDSITGPLHIFFRPEKCSCVKIWSAKQNRCRVFALVWHSVEIKFPARCFALCANNWPSLGTERTLGPPLAARAWIKTLHARPQPAAAAQCHICAHQRVYTHRPLFAARAPRCDFTRNVHQILAIV